MKKTPTERLEAESYARRAERELRAVNAAMAAEIDELKIRAGFVADVASTPLVVPEWSVKPSGSGHEGNVMAQLTDPHFDETVKPEEVLGINAYNRQIAESRFGQWAEKVVTLPRDYVRGVKLAGLKVLSTGDTFTGDIHAELKESNADKILSSLVHWTEPVIGALELFEREYDNVSVDVVVGNHTRLSIRPVFKGRVHDNLDYLFWTNVKMRLLDRGSKVIVNVSPSMDANVPVYGRNLLITHGDQFHGGTGISGVLAPLMLGSHRKGQRQAATHTPMDLMVMGHFHQLLDLPGIIVGGSMKGYDEYAFGLNLRPEQASQMMWVETPERGKTITIPVFLQDRKREGW
jgi:hypothetical protein